LRQNRSVDLPRSSKMNEALMNPTPTVAREDMQSVMGKQMTPEDGLAMLLAAKSKSTQPYWALMRVAAIGEKPIWEGLRHLQKLYQPIMDAIHQLEGDKPLLSQIDDVWQKLTVHAGIWEGVVSPILAPKQEKLGTHMEVLFSDRAKEHSHPAFKLARVLDPLNFKTEKGEWESRADQLQGDEAACLQLLERLTGGDEGVKKEWENLVFSYFPKDMARFLPRLHEVTDDGGKSIVASAADRRRWWTRFASKSFPLIAMAADRLLSMHSTSCAVERNWSIWGQVYSKLRNRLSLPLGEMIVFIRGNLVPAAESADELVVMKLMEEMEAEGL
jgi:hypothetical protein